MSVFAKFVIMQIVVIPNNTNHHAVYCSANTMYRPAGSLGLSHIFGAELSAFIYDIHT